tara:strand:- start:524 stop:757 length:234 start_codon:yes stop_codon:yes gene_type:complete
MKKLNKVEILEWSSTGILLLGVYLTSINIYPLNVYVSLVGNVGWLTVGVIWKKWSLFTVQAVICGIYVFGYLSKFFT